MSPFGSVRMRAMANTFEGHIRRRNAPLFKLPLEHPARKFLQTFIECVGTYAGAELPPPYGRDVDQRWWSPTENRFLTFSGFVYEHLCFTVVLDGWLTAAPQLTDSE